MDVGGEEGELWVADSGVKEERHEARLGKCREIGSFLGGVRDDAALFDLEVTHTCSIESRSAAMRPSVPSMTLCLDLWQGPHSHSFSSTFTTSLSMGGSWQYWWYAVVHTSQKTILLLLGSVPRWQMLHCAARIVLVDLRRFTLLVGSGMVGTKATGLFTLRPDFVRVGNGVYEDEMSESSWAMSEGSWAELGHQLTSLAALSPLFRLLPLPPPLPLPRPLPDALPDAGVLPDDGAPASLLSALGVPTLPPLPRLPALATGGGVGSLSLVT